MEQTGNNRAREAEESILGPFRESIWEPFLAGMARYRLVEPGDRIAVCISGGKDSMLLAVLTRMARQMGLFPAEVVWLVMDPGYHPENRARVEENARLLEIPCTFFDSDIFAVANAQEKNPCFLCAKMRRGHLYSKARELGCNKIALGHHRNDVIETTLLSMLYGAQLQAMPPKLQAANFPGMALIRPLFLVREEAIKAWRDRNGLSFLQCACRFTEASQNSSKRREVKALIARLRQEDPLVEDHLFESLHGLRRETFPGWKTGGVLHTFPDRPDTGGEGGT